ncbi:MAG: transcriptional regulator [Desulfobacteraceae bacterium]|nr:transcriptional regulator [Desulfobacteraceae bacterium]MBC2754754.1 transcriptional regulator [Desulfobacteraceae bacterium]
MSETSNKIYLKKYSNRRLYDTEKSVYITLNEVAEMVKQGRWIEVTDVDSGEDVTAFTLTQIVMEEAKKKNTLLPVPLLHLVIRYGETELSDFFGKYLEKMINSYLTYKNVADEQFNKWLEMGAAITQGAQPPFTAENPLQSFFKQFFSVPKPGGETDDEKSPGE